jgi:hypothetical protein
MELLDSTGQPPHWGDYLIFDPNVASHLASIELAASFAVEIDRLQRPSIRASSNARHPILYASFDES